MDSRKRTLIRKFLVLLSGLVAAAVLYSFFVTHDLPSTLEKEVQDRKMEKDMMKSRQIEVTHDMPSTLEKELQDRKMEKDMMKSRQIEVLIPDDYKGEPCNYTLDLPQDKIIEKIESYRFPGVEHYITDLFPESYNQVLPEDPVFVTAFSSNHYQEGLAMIYNFNTRIKKSKNYTLIVYDIGLKSEQVAQVEKECKCKVERFRFEDYPEHVIILKPCSWKPIIMQLVAKRHPFVAWCDASVRFTTTDITDIIKATKQYGMLGNGGGGSIAHRTSIETFRFLNEPPCLYLKSKEIESNFVFVYQTPFIIQYFMKPWVSCALSRGCLTPFTPFKDIPTIMDCNGPHHYFHCHREQSILGILVNRLFHKELQKHIFDNHKRKYYHICRDCKKKQ